MTTIYIFILKLFTCLPSRLYTFCGDLTAKLLVCGTYLKKGVFAENLKENLGIQPGTPEFEVFRAEYIHQQVHISLESFIGLLWPNKISFGRKNAQRSKDEQPKIKRHILITGHIGAWELLCLQLGGYQDPLLLAKPTKYKQINQIVDRLRSQSHSSILWVEGFKKTYKTVLDALGHGGNVGFVFDQKSDNRKGPRVKFFNHITDFVVGPALFYEKTKSPIVFIYCLRVSAFTYETHEFECSRPDLANLDRVQITEFLANQLENVIRRHPHQWLWHYRKWRY